MVFDNVGAIEATLSRIESTSLGVVAGVQAIRRRAGAS